MAVDEVGFQRMLGRVREFRQRVSELGLSTSGIDANIRGSARISVYLTGSSGGVVTIAA
jgi:hypothetical protein